MSQSPPKTMQTVQYDRYGGAEVLELRRVKVPTPGPEEVLVRVHASGLNPKDAIIRSGFFKRFSGRVFPKGTGFDFAGEVSEVGAGAQGFRPGQKVWGFLDGFDGGSAAEYVAVPQSWLAQMPEGSPYAEVAALPLVGLTALQALRDKASLKNGEKLLIKGASGGAGSAAIQLAKALGAHVTAVASAASLEHCRRLGVDEVVDYNHTDPLSLEGRFDVFLDLYGGSPFYTYRRLLERRGRFVTATPDPSVFLVRVVTRLLPGPKADFVFVKPKRDDLVTLAAYVEAGALSMPRGRLHARDGPGGPPRRGREARARQTRPARPGTRGGRCRRRGRGAATARGAGGLSEMTKLNALLIRTSRSSWRFALLTVLNASAFTVLFALEDRFEAITGLPVFDTQNGLTPEALVQQLLRYQGEALEAYLYFAAFDFVFPFVAALFLALTWALLLRVTPWRLTQRLLAWGAGTGFDYLENLSLLSVLAMDTQSGLMVNAAILYKRLKLAALILSNALTVVLGCSRLSPRSSVLGGHAHVG